MRLNVIYCEVFQTSGFPTWLGGPRLSYQLLAQQSEPALLPEKTIRLDPIEGQCGRTQTLGGPDPMGPYLLLSDFCSITPLHFVNDSPRDVWPPIAVTTTILVKSIGTPWKFAMLSSSPLVQWWKQLFLPLTWPFPLPPPPHTMLLQGGHFEHTDPTLIGVGGGGGGSGRGMVKLSKKAKCTMTFDQDCRLFWATSHTMWFHSNFYKERLQHYLWWSKLGLPAQLLHLQVENSGHPLLGDLWSPQDLHL